MTNLTPVSGDISRLALYYEQRERILARTRAETAAYHANGSIFFSMILKTLLWFNGAVILGYPVFMSYLPDHLMTEDICQGLEFLFQHFLSSFTMATIAVFCAYGRWECIGKKTHLDEEIEIMELDHLVEQSSCTDQSVDLKCLENKKRTKGRYDIAAGYMHVSCMVFGPSSVVFTLITVWGTSALIQHFPSP